MAKVTAFVDGFNLYHSILEKIDPSKTIHLTSPPAPPPVPQPHFKQYKWLDLKELITHFIDKDDTIEDVYYFTTIADWSPRKSAKHNKYIQALKHTGVKVVFGNFKRFPKKCHHCEKITNPPIEKKTDVNIATYMLRLAFEDKYDKAILISGDTDLVPVIEAIKKVKPSKIINVASPMGRKPRELKKVAHSQVSISEFHLSKSMFDKEIEVDSQTKIQCPLDWIYIAPPNPVSPNLPTNKPV